MKITDVTEVENMEITDVAFKIYQAKSEELFFGYYKKFYEHLNNLDVDLNDYNCIYEDSICCGRFRDETFDLYHTKTCIEQILEEIFIKFNIRIPKDFTGHSLSIGDVIEIGGDYYVVDRIGFKKIERKEK